MRPLSYGRRNVPNATNARDDAGNTATSLQIVNRADQADSELSSMSR